MTRVTVPAVMAILPLAATVLWEPGSAAGGAPTAGTTASLAPERRTAASLVAGTTPDSLRFRYWDAAGVSRYWNNSAWTTTVAEAADSRTDDYHLIGLEIDGNRRRFRWLAGHERQDAIGDAAQGPKLAVLSDWVPLSTWADTSNLRLCIGQRYTDAPKPVDWSIEWVRREHHPVVRHAYTNADTGGPRYTLRHQYSYGQKFLPDDRSVDGIIPWGLPGAWDAHHHRHHHVIRVGERYYLFYEGYEDAATAHVGLATADAAEGPWTKHPANPLVSPTDLAATGYTEVSQPWVVYDVNETDPTKQWKLFVSGRIDGGNALRLFLLTSNQASGPYVKAPGDGPDGSVLAESGLGDWRDDAVSQPVIWWDDVALRWRMLVGGLHLAADGGIERGWSVGLLDSNDLIHWTEEPGNPLLAGTDHTRQSWRAAYGNRIIVDDGGAFSQDAVVVLRDASIGTVAVSRVRSIVGNTLDLYHYVRGTTATGSIVQLTDGASISPNFLARDPDGTLRLYVTIFQPWIREAAFGFGNLELSASYTGPDVWNLAPDHASNLDVFAHAWDALTNQENVCLVSGPVDSGGRAAAVAPTREGYGRGKPTKPPHGLRAVGAATSTLPGRTDSTTWYGFLDNFEGGELDAAFWTPITEGGKVEVIDGTLHIVAAAGQAAFVYLNEVIDPGESQLLLIAMKRSSSDNTEASFGLWNP